MGLLLVLLEWPGCGHHAGLCSRLLVPPFHSPTDPIVASTARARSIIADACARAFDSTCRCRRTAASDQRLLHDALHRGVRCRIFRFDVLSVLSTTPYAMRSIDWVIATSRCADRIRLDRSAMLTRLICSLSNLPYRRVLSVQVVAESVAFFSWPVYCRPYCRWPECRLRIALSIAFGKRMTNSTNLSADAAAAATDATDADRWTRASE